MSAEDLEKFETEQELALYREYRDVVGLFSHVVETERRFYLCNDVDLRVRGEGAGSVPTGEDHLVVRALREGLDHVGSAQSGLRMVCTNRIPHGRGLGSSAAATVAGLLLARGMLADPEALDDQTVLELATEFEGHPDNAAPALLGGAVLSWMSGAGARAVPLRLGEDVLRPVVMLPTTTLSTDRARGLLPAEVPHRDAAVNASRAALLVHALAGEPELLLEATEDRLHQEQRAPGMPESVELMRVLRAEGHPAVISGAGPSVLVLAGRRAEIAPLVRRFVADPAAWRIAEVPLRRAAAAPVVG